MIYLDSSSLKTWGCREFYRLSFLRNLAPAKPSPYYELGKATHTAIEYFWAGKPFEKAMDAAYEICNTYPVALLNPPEMEHWRKSVDALPDLISCYYDSVKYEPENLLMVEQEFTVPLTDKVTLCGRVDRVMKGPRLVDVKTASEISRLGVPWRKQYREEKLLDPQFGLYDFWLQSLGTPAVECYLEVILKPYKGKKAKLEIIPLAEIVTDAYRNRFRQQIMWAATELAFFREKYANQHPWPQNSNMCVTKFSACPMMDICLFGEQPKIMEKYVTRVEHLKVRGAAE